VTVNGTAGRDGTTLAPRQLAVAYAVSPGGSISLASAAVDFTTWVGGPDPAPKSVAVTNGGAAGSVLDGLQVTSAGGAWLRGAVDVTTAPSTLTIAPTTSGLTAGTYTGTVTVSSALTPDARAVAVTLTMTAAPKITVAPASVAMSGVSGTVPAAQTVTISNTGGAALSGIAVGTITYAAGATGWLAAQLSGATAPATLTLQPLAAAGQLAAGTYTANVPLTSTLAGVSATTITVTLTVQATPSLVLDPASVKFEGDIGAPTPGAFDVAVTNGGGGTLGGLAVGSITYGSGATNWLSASIAGAAAPTTLHLQPTTTGLPAGTYTATVEVGSSTAGVAAKSVAVTYTLTANPVIAVSRSAVTFSAVANAALPAEQTVTVTNSGTGSLGTLSSSVAYQGTATGWLTATFASGSGGLTLTLRPNTTALPTGTVTATVRIVSSVAGVAGKLVNVTYNVTPVVPIIQLSTTTAFQLREFGDADTNAPFVVNITNGTPGTTLSGLSASATYSESAPNLENWLLLAFDQTTAPAQLSITIRGSTAQDLKPGNHVATVRVESSVPGVAPGNVTVTLQVYPTPCVKVSPTAITFNTTEFTEPPVQTIQVTNGCGDFPLRQLSASTDGRVGLVLITPDAPTAAVMRSFNVSLKMAPGTYTGVANIKSDNCSNGCRPHNPAFINWTINVLPGVGTVAVTPSPVTVAVGNTVQLSATVQVSTGVDKTVTWSSDNTNVATVSSTGLVTALRSGSARIAATSTVDPTKVGFVNVTVP
jgi:hypothetical protein